MPKHEILVAGPLLDSVQKRLEQTYAVHRLWEQRDAVAYLKQEGARMKALVTRGDLGASASLLAALPSIGIIACYGVGVDGIDFDHVRRHQIAVTNTPDVLTADVAELAIGLLIATARRIPASDRFVRDRLWPNGSPALTRRLAGSKVGVVGMGRIGAAIASRLVGLECDISYFARAARRGLPYAFFDDILALAAHVDILVVALSGSPGTERMVSGPVLDALGPEGIVINVARGTVLDEIALLDALENGTVAGAGLDVFENEPQINGRFLGLDNVVLQPHMGSATWQARTAMGDLVLANLAAHFAGEPLVTPVP